MHATIMQSKTTKLEHLLKECFQKHTKGQEEILFGFNSPDHIRVQIMLRFASSRRYFIWTWILIVSNTLFIQAKRCLPLSRCQEVQWIAEKQAELDISSKILNQISCGFEGGQPKVWCNVEGGIEDSSLYGTFQMLVQRPSQCIGQLKVYTAMENSLQIYNFRTGRSYGNLRNLNRIYRISSLGNCCWKMHLRPSFRGSGHKITAGFDDVPPFQFLSLKSTIC